MSDMKEFLGDGPIIGPIRRVLSLAVVGALIICLSCMAQFRTTSWVYDNKTGSPYLLSCPRSNFAVQRSDLVDSGRFCKVRLFNWDNRIRNDYLSVSGPFGPGYRCLVPNFENTNENSDEFVHFASKNPIVCQVSKPCTQTRFCTLEQAGAPVIVQCPRGPEEAGELSRISGLSLMVSLSPTAGFYVDWERYGDTIFEEYCDGDFKISVGKVIAARGMIAALAFLILGWCIVEIGLWLQRRRNLKKGAQRGFDGQETEFEFNRTLTEVLWPNRRMTSAPGTPSVREGMVARTVTASSSCKHGDSRSFKVAVCQDPWKAFTSVNWRKKVEMYHQGKSLKPSYPSKPSLAKVISIPMFVLLVGFLIAWAFLAISPGDVLNTHSVADTLFSGYSKIWRAKSTWTILPFLFLDELLSVFMFLCSSPVVRWGRKTVCSHLKERGDSMSVDSFSPSSSIKVVPVDLVPPGVVAVMCVDGRRLEEDEEFLQNVHSVIAVVGIERFFVLQFSNSHSPLDNTAVLLQKKISLGIQYLFVPERDKLTAVYWFSKYYLPLFQLHQSADHHLQISHVMVVDQTVQVPASLTIPHALIEASSTPDQKVGLICFAGASHACEDIEVKFEIADRIFQSDLASLGDSEFMGAVFTVWERESLEFAAFDHKPMTAASGGDFPAAGVNLFKPGGIKIKFISNCLIRVTPNPGNAWAGKMHAFARRKRLWFTDLVSLLSPASLFNANRLVSKPANLISLLANVFDFIRLPVLASSAMRDPVGLACILLLFIILQWIRIAVLSFAVIPTASSKDRPGLGTSIIHPFIHLVYNIIILRPLSIVFAVFGAVNDRPSQSIHEREDHEKTMPPCLPYPDAPWFSVWKPHS